ncbi:hypothetical protein C8F04DRAFT_1264663 [Mycena alexandri]|uniref:C2H2-type domain-containing protein n=1 Tax=Mycena alexandri TaxID=1745969 RepID=A0AAD6SKR5_9AGAR|nr:hypothetical protein C8F04DRAFT_1264663 [Mycena alexandri]
MSSTHLLSPSPSPSADQLLFAQQQQHPTNPHSMHPSLYYEAYPTSSSSYPPPARSESPPPPLDFASLDYPQAQGKRYRAAPPKTFQCAGYGECRMVFSRSEHLARHIRWVSFSFIFFRCVCGAAPLHPVSPTAPLPSLSLLLSPPLHSSPPSLSIPPFKPPFRGFCICIRPSHIFPPFRTPELLPYVTVLTLTPTPRPCPVFESGAVCAQSRRPESTKHTGERPFACHCSKQFSRLDNLRQHAQTVHSAPEDKPLNERMMRALAGVNASMMAGVRGRRRFGADASPPSSATPLSIGSSNSGSTSGSPLPSPGFAPPSFGSSNANNLPSPPYSSSNSNSNAVYGAEYAYSAYDGSPLPSPSFGAFPASSVSSSASSSGYQSSSPYASPAYDAGAGAADYLSAGFARAQQQVRVKQEELELDSLEVAVMGGAGGARGLEEMEGFYAALGAATAHGAGYAVRARPPPYARSRSSNSDASSPSSGSGSGSAGPSTSTSTSPSPAGSPCVPSFWPAQAQAQRQRQQQQQQGGGLPSPPQSPGYYASRPPHAHAPAHAPAPAQQEWWTIEQGEGGEGAQEMSNAEYYAALQAQAHPHPYSPHAAHHAQEGYFHAHGYGAPPAHGHAHAPGQYAVFA